MKEAAASGATGAGAIANTRGSLFGGGIIDLKQARKRQLKLMRRIANYHIIGEGLGVDLGKNDYSPADVISKLDDAEKKSKIDKDTTAFGLEDEDGNLVKVYVKSEQADDFEHALSDMLAGNDENDDDENSAAEIAEVIFKLKDKFEIVNVEWPTIEGDEEEEQEVVGDETGMDDEGDLGAEADLGGEDELGLDGEGEDQGASDEEAAKSALQQVIDLLKADAESKTAEARAKEAEANAKEAEYAAQAAASKVSQEEEVLDMEAYYKDKADQEKEAKQLAKLAKYKHDLAKDANASLSMESADAKEEKDDEEEDDDTITTDELAELIFNRLRAN